MSKTTNMHKSLSKSSRVESRQRAHLAKAARYQSLCLPLPRCPLWVQIEDNVVTSLRLRSENNNKCMEKQITIRFTSSSNCRSSNCRRIFKIIPFVKIDCSLSIKKSTLQASRECRTREEEGGSTVAKMKQQQRGSVWSKLAMWHVDRRETCCGGHKSLVQLTDLCEPVTLSIYSYCPTD